MDYSILGLTSAFILLVMSNITPPLVTARTMSST
jgi:hypothetical protein